MDQFPTFLLWIVSTALAVGAAYRMGLRHMAGEVDEQKRQLKNAIQMMVETGREFADLVNERDRWQQATVKSCAEAASWRRKYCRLRQAVKDGTTWRMELED